MLNLLWMRSSRDRRTRAYGECIYMQPYGIDPSSCTEHPAKLQRRD